MAEQISFGRLGTGFAGPHEAEATAGFFALAFAEDSADKWIRMTNSGGERGTGREGRRHGGPL